MAVAKRKIKQIGVIGWMNKQEFREVMEGLKSLYGGKIPDMNGFAREIWYECLSDMDFDRTKNAITNHIKSSKFPPTVADIREHYQLITKSEIGNNLELEKIYEEMRNYYPNGNNDDKNARGLFFSKLLMVKKEDKYEWATNVKKKVCDYVIECEKGIKELNMTLSECIQWAVSK